MLIKNGLLVTEQSCEVADLRILEGVICEISSSLIPQNGEEVIDAAGKIVLPGGIDVHTHLDLDLGNVKATDDFYTGTVAAAIGGTTTIVDHIGFGPKGCDLGHQIDVYHKLAAGKAVIDYSFHGVIDHVDEGIFEEMDALIEAGITSFKFYLTYGGKLEDSDVMKLMEHTVKKKPMLCVHPENDGALSFYREKFIKAGCKAPFYHPLSRPAQCEADAISRMLLFADMAGEAPLYIVHLSNGLGLEIFEAALSRGQKHIYSETCPQYLLLDDSLYQSADGLKYIMSPPLRKQADEEALWKGIKNGTIKTIATDHCPFNYQGEKQLGKDDFTKAPGGAPGVETRMGLIYSEGVTKGRLTLNEYANVTATNPAKLFGMYPEKGTLALGSDGDVVIIDPSIKTTITKSMLHENVDYTPYEGINVQGWPVMTITRGQVVAKDGAYLGGEPKGRFLKRKLPMFL